MSLYINFRNLYRHNPQSKNKKVARSTSLKREEGICDCDRDFDHYGDFGKNRSIQNAILKK
jgi:hypothetical protein